MRMLKAGLIATAIGGLLGLGTLVPADAATPNASAFYSTQSACGTAMASQQRAGRYVEGCYHTNQIIGSWYFIYYT